MGGKTVKSKRAFGALARRVEKMRAKIAADRDELAELVNDAAALLDSVTEADEALRTAVDKLSEYA